MKLPASFLSTKNTTKLTVYLQKKGHVNHKQKQNKIYIFLPKLFSYLPSNNNIYSVMFARSYY